VHWWESKGGPRLALLGVREEQARCFGTLLSLLHFWLIMFSLWLCNSQYAFVRFLLNVANESGEVGCRTSHS
jgi:hypothetical protein